MNADEAGAALIQALREKTYDAEERRELRPEDFAVPGKKKLIIRDRSHTAKAWARLPQTKGLTDPERAEAKRRILARAKELGMDTGHWKGVTEALLVHDDFGAEVQMAEFLLREAWDDRLVLAELSFGGRAGERPRHEPNDTEVGHARNGYLAAEAHIAGHIRIAKTPDGKEFVLFGTDKNGRMLQVRVQFDHPVAMAAFQKAIESLMAEREAASKKRK